MNKNFVQGSSNRSNRGKNNNENPPIRRISDKVKGKGDKDINYWHTGPDGELVQGMPEDRSHEWDAMGNHRSEVNYQAFLENYATDDSGGGRDGQCIGSGTCYNTLGQNLGSCASRYTEGLCLGCVGTNCTWVYEDLIDTVDDGYMDHCSFSRTAAPVQHGTRVYDINYDNLGPGWKNGKCNYWNEAASSWCMYSIETKYASAGTHNNWICEYSTLPPYPCGTDWKCFNPECSDSCWDEALDQRWMSSQAGMSTACDPNGYFGNTMNQCEIRGIPRRNITDGCFNQAVNTWDTFCTGPNAIPGDGIPFYGCMMNFGFSDFNDCPTPTYNCSQCSGTDGSGVCESWFDGGLNPYPDINDCTQGCSATHGRGNACYTISSLGGLTSGCLHPEATNYDGSADFDHLCNDPWNCNYTYDQGTEDGSCNWGNVNVTGCKSCTIASVANGNKWFESNPDVSGKCIDGSEPYSPDLNQTVTGYMCELGNGYVECNCDPDAINHSSSKCTYPNNGPWYYDTDHDGFGSCPGSNPCDAGDGSCPIYVCHKEQIIAWNMPNEPAGCEVTDMSNLDLDWGNLCYPHYVQNCEDANDYNPNIGSDGTMGRSPYPDEGYEIDSDAVDDTPYGGDTDGGTDDIDDENYNWVQDCEGVVGGDSVEDHFGNCCLPDEMDVCGVCNGNNTTCTGCWTFACAPCWNSYLNNSDVDGDEIWAICDDSDLLDQMGWGPGYDPSPGGSWSMQQCSDWSHQENNYNSGSSLHYNISQEWIDEGFVGYGGLCPYSDGDDGWPGVGGEYAHAIGCHSMGMCPIYGAAFCNQDIPTGNCPSPEEAVTYGTGTCCDITSQSECEDCPDCWWHPTYNDCLSNNCYCCYPTSCQAANLGNEGTGEANVWIWEDMEEICSVYGNRNYPVCANYRWSTYGDCRDSGCASGDPNLPFSGDTKENTVWCVNENNEHHSWIQTHTKCDKQQVYYGDNSPFSQSGPGYSVTSCSYWGNMSFSQNWGSCVPKSYTGGGIQPPRSDDKQWHGQCPPGQCYTGSQHGCQDCSGNITN